MTEKQDTTEDVESKLPLEPEQLTLWRKIIDYRDRLVRQIADNDAFLRHQREGWRPLDQYPDDTRDFAQEMRERSERQFDHFRDLVTEVDAALHPGARLSLGQLKKWSATEDRLKREEILGHVKLYLDAAPRDRELCRRTVNAVVRRNYRIQCDVAEIEAKERADRDEGSSGHLDRLAKAITDHVAMLAADPD